MGQVLIETRCRIVVTKMHCCSALLATRTQGGDYHWYRLDANGMWSHKPGESQVSQTDNGRNPITDPRVSNNGAYQFAYFMESNAFTVLIRGNFVCGA